MLCGADCVQNLGARRPRSKPAHAAVDLQMISSRRAALRRHAIPVLNVVQRMDDGRQVVVQQSVAFGRQKIGHHQNSRRDSTIAQDGAFFHIADRQPARAHAGQSARYFDGSMTIGVGFHHRHYFYVRSDHVLDGAKIIGNLFERNLHPGSKSERPHGSNRAAAAAAFRTGLLPSPSYSARRRAPSPAAPIPGVLVPAFRGPASA